MEFLGGFADLLYTIVSFVIALSVIVTVHEYGHYIIGRISGIKAEVFSLGFGPKLISRVDKQGTRWQIAAIPLGGYVKFLGDANAASAGVDEGAMAVLSPEERRHTMHGAPLWARAATVAAGPVFNFILSILVIAGLMMWSGTPTEKPAIATLIELPEGTGDLRPGDQIIAIEGQETPDYDTINTLVEKLPSQPTLTWRIERDGVSQEITGPQLFPPVLVGVAPSSAAYDAGILPDDVIVSIDGAPIWRFADLQAAVRAAEGKPLALEIWSPSSGETRPVTLSARRTDLPVGDGVFETRWLIGANGGFVFEPETRPTAISDALIGGVRQTWGIVAQSISGLKAMILKQISSCNLSGALRIAESSAAAAKGGMPDFIWFIAVLSTAVGFLNLLPIPVLDGGHLMFHLWEGITGKPPSDKVLNALMAMGLSLVLTLMLFGLWNDLFC
ncbi:RIP metalloprotease RseP [Pseudothioclava arenosa]|uniref:Zinc metalloprotease n=1 Tax=Pseudothioclava arenosa TaxID=1795308 RepID=A0A2A4CNA4_9RHOB|nr:RIP metalloprotease RseP [Pseudothioclava arenosa]PCD75800.1 RIP metalloprotease RseP [Pseudothioclava arenosa]